MADESMASHMTAATATLAPPSTGKKKARARMVFGDSIIVDDDDGAAANDTSRNNSSHIESDRSSTLSYSPSPPRKKSPPPGAATTTTQLHKVEAAAVRQQTDENSTPPAQNRSNNGFSSSSHDDNTAGSRSSSCSDSNFSSFPRRPRSVGPFDKIIAPSMDNENGTADSSSLHQDNNKASSTATDKRSEANSKMKSIISTSNRPAAASRQQQQRIMMQQQRPTRSPLRHDMVQKTQAAIQKASISVNQSLGAARQAKLADLHVKTSTTATLRQEWKQDDTDARAFHQAMDASRNQVLRLQRQLSSRNSKQKAQRRLMQRQANLDEMDKESKFKSSVYRDHQLTLQQQQADKRRQSTEARAKLRQNAKQGQQKLYLQRIEEDEALYDERNEASVALRTTQTQNAQQRRNSFAFHNGDARRIRELHALWETDRQAQDHASHELERQAAQDAQAYQEQLAQERRESLARRNEYARQQRQEQQKQSSDELQQEHESIQLTLAAERDAHAYQEQLAAERRQSLAGRNAESFHWQKEADRQRNQHKNAEHDSYELKWEGDKDAEAYQRQLAKERRESLEQRNQHARRQRAQADCQHHKQQDREHQSYELKWSGEKDAEQYQLQLQEERRKSHAFRNLEGKRQRDQQSQQEADNSKHQHESYELKWAGEHDADEYRQQMDRERRESLAGRNAQAHRQRQQQMQQDSQAQQAEHESYELKWAGEKDAEEYQRKMEAERRQSLQHRNKEHVRHQNVMQELESIAREREHESRVLEWAAEEDAKSYLAQLDQERRQSLQLRGRQVVHGRKVENEQREQALEQLHQDEELHAADQRKVNEYQKQCAERDRASLEFRRKEARTQRIEESGRLAEQQRLDHANFELETQAHGDVEEYVSDCQARRRLSLAFRAKEKRCHAQWKREQQEKERNDRARQVQGRLMDARHQELARMEERAKIAMDAIMHAGCSFNPFNNVI